MKIQKQTYHIFYNPLSGNRTGKECVENIKRMLGEAETKCYDLLTCENLPEIVKCIPKEEHILITGGDGTLNHFVNEMEVDGLPNRIYYYPAGSGNDFIKDVCPEGMERPGDIRDYISGLPVVKVNGNSFYFLNGIGFGLDGVCCEIGNEKRKRSRKPVHYTAIALKNILFGYKPQKTVIEVDGTIYHFDKVWLATTMFGKYLGGGMMFAPDQERKKNGKVTCMVMHNTGRFRILYMFPKVFQGKHGRFKKRICFLEGIKIRVTYERPTSMQMDGETIREVREYMVCAGNDLEDVPHWERGD